MSEGRAELLAMLAEKSFKLGQFKLSSGQSSDYYVDCRTTTLDGRGALLVGELVCDEMQRRGWRAEGIGGLTLGADPIAVTAAVVSTGRGAPLHAFLVRKAEKQHGMGQRIEGFQRAGASVVIVDDVCTTGASTIQAIEAARAAQFSIAGVLCLLEREEAGGRANVEHAAAPAPFVALFTAREVREVYLRRK
ncbi:MAG: orotate phosphoribosyltransferase [Acidobacteria bacterium]|nr:orotate phosphoribosyltransferase [Acidobacteriota bacterium]